MVASSLDNCQSKLSSESIHRMMSEGWIENQQTFPEGIFAFETEA